MNHINYLLLLTLLLGFCTSCQGQDNPETYTIVYESVDTGNLEIYYGDLEGEPTIEALEAKGGYLAWSPDGEHFAFYAKYDDRKTWSIHTMKVDGSNRKRLTHTINKWDSAPAWSPDGKKIAFAREYKDAEGVSHAEIWIMNSDGTEQMQIKSLRGSNPYFTPDGKIVFSAEMEGHDSELAIADIDGANIVQLTDNNSNEWHTDVSPDGKQITFMSDKDGNYEIYVMNIDGSNQERLTHNEFDDWYPSWSHDSAKIAFSQLEDYENNRHIYVMNKDGSELKKIVSNSGYAIFDRHP